MQHMMIENNGVCPIEGLTMLGLSTARGTDKIGQFGTGTKNAIAFLVRNNMAPTYALGDDIVRFHAEDRKMGDKDYKAIVYTVNDGPTHETNMSTEFGELDWDDISMPLREIFSNALDQNDNQRCKVSFVDTIKGESGKTRVFVPSSPEIFGYFSDIGNYFLHFSMNKDVDHTSVMIPNDKGNKLRMYRRGVYVRTLKLGNHTCLYDYNSANLKVDDCRNSNDDDCHRAVAACIADNESLFLEMIKAVKDGNMLLYEAHIWRYYYYYTMQNKKKMQMHWEKHFPDYYVTSNPIIHDNASRKNKKVLLVPVNLYELLMACDAQDAVRLLTLGEENGCVSLPVTPELKANVNKVWNRICSYGMDAGLYSPKVKMYEKAMDAGSESCGFYDEANDTIWIHEAHQHNLQTILEELAHHVTKASDCTRDFQDWAFRFAAKSM